MGKRIKKWEKDIKANLPGIIFAIFLFIIVGIINNLAGSYVDSVEAVTVPDLILDNIQTYQLGEIYVIGIFLFISCLIIYPLIFKPKYFSFAVFQLSLLIMIRNVFIVLTHIKAPIDHLIINFPSIINSWNFHNDLFFSGHAAIPFLGFLIFKDYKIKYFFLIGSIVMGATVLLTKMHYSIDVFSAFFICYASYKIGKNILKNKKLNFIKIPKKYIPKS